MILLYEPILKPVSRELRNNMTETEHLVWTAIRGKKLCGIQFYRQKTIGSYIVDFYAPSANLVIEIDGFHHLKQENIEQDRYRDSYLKELGLRVLRFGNDQVKSSLPYVIKQIVNALIIKKS